MEDPYMNLEPADFFNLLESNQPSVVEDIKCLIHDHLNVTKEAWLVHGLYDYSLAKSSQRAMEILLGLREPHAKHLFDKLSESLRSGQRLSALIFMGFLVRRQPQWLHKISSHYVMRDIIRILKSDGDVVVLVNALLVLTALIPIIPNLESSILTDIFEGFSRLAAWNYSNQPRQPEVYVLHLQIALYALFHRLYGMYPCNFLVHLRNTYSVRENLPIFSHTVKPMVETVRMHPLLVTASKEIEIGTARWKHMSVHDIVTECAKYSLLECQEMAHREDLTCSLVHSATQCSEHAASHQTPWFDEAMNINGEWTSPSCQWMTTPIPKGRQTPLSRVVTPKSVEHEGQSSSKTSATSAARILSLTPTPTSAAPTAVPTSPMKKDAFKYPEADRRGSIISSKMQKIGQEPAPSFALLSGVISGMRSRHSSGAPLSDTRKNAINLNVLSDQLNAAAVAKEKEKEITPEDREVCRLLSSRPRDALEKETHALSQTWIQSREGTPSASLPSSRPESLPKLDDSQDGDDHKQLADQDQIVDDDTAEEEDEDERAEREERVEVSGNSPCHSGGLHMPDKRHISDFVRRVKRLRYFSQCLPIASAVQGSPGSGSSIGTVVDSFGAASSVTGTGPHPAVRKRSTSCPDLVHTFPDSSALESRRDQRLTKANGDEALSIKNRDQSFSNHACEAASTPTTRCSSVASQTEDLWPPTPYEHLFFSVLPPSLLLPPPPAPVESTARPVAPSELLDRYIDASFRSHERQVALQAQGKVNASEDVTLLKGQVLLLQSQLQFERHRREVHAERNRRLLSKAKNLRFLEEEVHTLRLQLVQAQNEMAALRRDADALRKTWNAAEVDKNNAIRQMEQKLRQNQQEIGELLSSRSQLEEDLAKVREENRHLRRVSDQLQAVLFDAEAEMTELKRRANDSRRYQQELKDAQYQLIAAREAANVLQQQLLHPPASQSKFEVEELTRSFKEEMKSHRENLERERRLNEALTAKLTDLEANAVKRETDMAELKRFLQTVKEEHQQHISVLEQKYESVKSINMALESSILQLRHQAELSRSRLNSRRRQIQTPAGAGTGHWISGDHPVVSAPPLAPGFSPSPGSPPSFSSHSGTSAEQLSVSLAVEASEGLNEFYWQGIESSDVAELPLEQTGEHQPRCRPCEMETGPDDDPSSTH